MPLCLPELHLHHRKLLTIWTQDASGMRQLSSANQDELRSTSKRLARKSRQFQRVQATFGPYGPPPDGSNVSQRSCTCIEITWRTKYK
jgi:hypothetical protein